MISVCQLHMYMEYFWVALIFIHNTYSERKYDQKR